MVSSMKYLLVTLAFGLCLNAVRAEDWSSLELDDTSEGRFLFNGSSSNSIIPDARAIVALVLIGILLFSTVGASAFSGLIPAQRNSYDNFYDPYASSQYAQQQYQQRLGDYSAEIAQKMEQLDQAHRKYEE